MNTYNAIPTERTKNYRDVTVYSATEYYKEIQRAQRGWKEFAYAINDSEKPNMCQVVKDGKIVATITVVLN